MKYLRIFILCFVTGLGIGYLIPHDNSCVWNLWDDPRGCTIRWDDGTFSYKSPTIKLGTLMPGESKEVTICTSLFPDPEDLPRSNGMIHHLVYGSYPEQLEWNNEDANNVALNIEDEAFE